MKLFEFKKGIPRKLMPQIHTEDIQGIYDYVEDMVSLKSMKPVQTDREDHEYKDAVKKIKNKKAKQILLDRNLRIVNGHHRYDAYRHLGYDEVPAVIVDASLEELIDKFSHTTEEAGAGGGAGGGAAGGTGGAGATGGTSSGGEGGSTSSSGDSGSADSGDAGDSGSDSSDSTSSPNVNRGFFFGTMRPSRNYSKKKKKKKKKSGFNFGQGVYEDKIEFKSSIGIVSEKCWKGYKKKGMKTMFGKRVPNCVKNESEDGDKGNWEYFMQQLKASGWPQNPIPNADVEGKLVDLLNDPKAGKEHKELIRKYFNWGGGFDTAIPGDVIDQEQLGKVTVLKIIGKDMYNMPAEYLVKTQKGSILPISFDELVLGNEYGSETDIDSSKLMNSVDENFKDGKVKGKSRPGRVKKAGASCKGSVSSLRAKAKKYSGERGKMYHWCANMKSGRNK